MVISIAKWEIRVSARSVRLTGKILRKGGGATRKLENLLEDTGAKSLTDFRKNHDK
jgi:hypothetical protein